MTGMRVAIGKIHQLFVCNRNDAPWDDVAKAELCAIVGERFEGFTLQEGVGYFRSNPAPTLVVTIGTNDTEAVCAIGHRLRLAFEQEGVGLSCDGIYQRLIALPG